MKNVRTTYFGELIDLSEAKLDEENHSVRVTIINPGWSKNQRHYGSAMLGKAAGLFEDTKAYADHPSKSEQRSRPERSVRDIVGRYENVRQENDGRLTGDLKVVGEAENWLWPLITDAVQNKPDLIGISINALAQTRKGQVDGKKGIVVEAILKANSADIVTTPAAGGKFETLLMSDDQFTRDLIEHMTLEELREVRPDIIDALKSEWKTVRQDDALEAARSKVEVANKALATEERKNATSRIKADKTKKQAGRMLESLTKVQAVLAVQVWESKIDRLLAGAKLPKEWKSKVRKRLVALEGDTRAAKALLAEEAEKLKAVRGPVKVTGAGRERATKTTAQNGSSAPLIFGGASTVREGESPKDYQKRTN